MKHQELLYGLGGIVLMIFSIMYLQIFMLLGLGFTAASPFLLQDVVKNVQIFSTVGAVMSVIALGFGLHLVNQNMTIITRFLAGLLGAATVLSGAIIILSIAAGNVSGIVVGVVFIVIGTGFMDYGFKLKMMPQVASVLAKI